MVTLTKKYHFSAGHILEGHATCGRLHGHNYEVVVEMDCDETAPQLHLDLVDFDAVILPVLEKISGKFLISTENIRLHNAYVDIAVDRGDGCITGVQTSAVQDIAEYIALNVRELLFGDTVVTVSDGTLQATYWSGTNERSA